GAVRPRLPRSRAPRPRPVPREGSCPGGCASLEQQLGMCQRSGNRQEPRAGPARCRGYPEEEPEERRRFGLRGERQAKHEVARSERLGQAELTAAARAHLRAVKIEGFEHEPSLAESPADRGRCRVEAADGGERSLSAPRGTFEVDAPGARGWSRRSELQ